MREPAHERQDIFELLDLLLAQRDLEYVVQHVLDLAPAHDGEHVLKDADFSFADSKGG